MDKEEALQRLAVQISGSWRGRDDIKSVKSSQFLRHTLAVKEEDGKQFIKGDVFVLINGEDEYVVHVELRDGKLNLLWPTDREKIPLAIKEQTDEDVESGT